MAARIRILVAHAQGSRSPVPALVYKAEVIDEDAAPSSLWLCSHDHVEPTAAQQCARDWMARVRRALGFGGLDPMEMQGTQPSA